MNPKVAASFTIVLTLAMILSANPAMTMPSSIFASSSDGGSSDGGRGSSDGGSSDVVQMGMMAHQKMNSQK